jgi:hypothetical protein
MANELTTLPPKSKELMVKREKLRVLNDVMLESISAGMYQQLAVFGMRFLLKKEGTIEEIERLKIPVVILNAKGPFEKKWWRGKYDPNKTETKPPDCMSFDGIYPDPSVDPCLRGAENCATCERNAFGSGTDANGDPSKGKACQDRKLLVLYYSSEIYGFSLPPGSIKAWRKYVNDLDDKGYSVCEVATILGFDSRFTYPVLTFTAHGPLSEEQMVKVEEMIDCEETQTIISFGMKKERMLPAPTTTTHKEPESVVEPEVVIEVDPDDLGADDLGLGLDDTPEPESKPEVTPPPKEKKATKKTSPPVTPEPKPTKIPTPDEVDDLLNL